MTLRIPLLWRMILPTVAVSVLLLASGIAASVAVHMGSLQAANVLDARVEAVIGVEELLLAIRDVRLGIYRYASDLDPLLLAEARAASQRAQTRLADLQTSRLPMAGLDDIARGLQAVDVALSTPEPPSREASQKLRQQITERVLEQSYQLLQSCRSAASEDSRRNQQRAQRIGTALAVLGVSGSVAGLVAGYGVARGVSRTMEQLGGSLRSMAASLAPEIDRSASNAGFRDLMAEMSNVQELASGLQSELEQSRKNAARTDQLAAVGQLAAGIAHELRNPLTAIKLLADAADERDATLRGPDLTVLRAEARRMQEMLQSFLDFARPPRLVREPTSAASVVAAAVDLVKPQASRLRIALALRLEPCGLISADPQQLRQVVLNLLLNAIDAQPQGGAVDVAVRPDQRGDLAGCLIEVRDAGPGVPEELSDRIFEPFVSTKETGIGLGLAISSRIVRWHGGELHVANLPERGASFSVFLPLAGLTSASPRTSA